MVNRDLFNEVRFKAFELFQIDKGLIEKYSRLADFERLHSIFVMTLTHLDFMRDTGLITDEEYKKYYKEVKLIS